MIGSVEGAPEEGLRGCAAERMCGAEVREVLPQIVGKRGAVGTGEVVESDADDVGSGDDGDVAGVGLAVEGADRGGAACPGAVGRSRLAGGESDDDALMLVDEVDPVVSVGGVGDRGRFSVIGDVELSAPVGFLGVGECHDGRVCLDHGPAAVIMDFRRAGVADAEVGERALDFVVHVLVVAAGGWLSRDDRLEADRVDHVGCREGQRREDVEALVGISGGAVARRG